MADSVLLTRFGFFICGDGCAGVIGISLISTLLFLLHSSLRTRFLSHFSVTCACLLSALPFCGLTFVEVTFWAVTSSVHVDVWLNGEPGSEASLVAVESALIVTTPLKRRKETRHLLSICSIELLIIFSLAILILGSFFTRRKD